MKQYKLLEGFHSMLPQEAIVPSKPSDIQEGDFVKIGVETNDGKAIEKFWAIVVERSAFDKGRFLVSINQDLHLTKYHGLKDTDELVVEFKHIVAVIR